MIRGPCLRRPKREPRILILTLTRETYVDLPDSFSRLQNPGQCPRMPRAIKGFWCNATFSVRQDLCTLFIFVHGGRLAPTSR